MGSVLGRERNGQERLEKENWISPWEGRHHRQEVDMHGSGMIGVATCHDTSDDTSPVTSLDGCRDIRISLRVYLFLSFFCEGGIYGPYS